MRGQHSFLDIIGPGFSVVEFREFNPNGESAEPRACPSIEESFWDGAVKVLDLDLLEAVLDFGRGTDLSWFGLRFSFAKSTCHELGLSLMRLLTCWRPMTEVEGKLKSDILRDSERRQWLPTCETRFADA